MLTCACMSGWICFCVVMADLCFFRIRDAHGFFKTIKGKYLSSVTKFIGLQHKLHMPK